MFKIAVLASTNGTDLQAIIDEMNRGKMPGIKLAVVISDKEESGAMIRTRQQDYEGVFVDPKGKTREEYDKEVAKILKEKKVDLICLIGYMRILSPWFVREFEGKIINVHPALDMKKYAGPGAMNLNVHKAVIENHEKESGCTIHYVTEEVDAGPIIAQADVVVESDDTPETLKKKVQEQEKLLYPEVIRRISRGEA
jgi:phosphoribosylglycinamide formyltransferase-1